MKNSLLSVCILISGYWLNAQHFRPDSTFGVNGSITLNAGVWHLNINSASTFLVFGTLDQNKPYIERYFNNGILDRSFGVEGRTILSEEADQSHFTSVLLHKNGELFTQRSSIYLGCPSYEVFMTTRLDTDGKKILGESVKYAHEVITVQPTTGFLIKLNLEIDKFSLLAFSGDGTYEQSFANRGTAVISHPEYKLFPWTIKPMSDGKILISGATDKGSVFLCRLTESGMPDPSFGDDGFVLTTGQEARLEQGKLAVDSAGNILLYGSYIRKTVVSKVKTVTVNFGTAIFNYSSTGVKLNEILPDTVQTPLHIKSIIPISGNCWLGIADLTYIVKLNVDGTIDEKFANKGKYMMPYKVHDIYQSGKSDFLFFHTNRIDRFTISNNSHVSSMTGPVNSIFIEMDIFPNPASSEINIFLPLNCKADQLSIYSLDGIMVMQYNTHEMQVNAQSVYVQLPEKLKGMYVLEFKASLGILRKKIMISN